MLDWIRQTYKTHTHALTQEDMLDWAKLVKYVFKAGPDLVYLTL